MSQIRKCCSGPVNEQVGALGRWCKTCGTYKQGPGYRIQTPELSPDMAVLCDHHNVHSESQQADALRRLEWCRDCGALDDGLPTANRHRMRFRLPEFLCIAIGRAGYSLFTQAGRDAHAAAQRAAAGRKRVAVRRLERVRMCAPFER